MAILRFLMLLSLVVWIGGIVFFAFVLAPTVFSVLPTRQLAGSVVNRALPILHWMGLVSGVVFLITSVAYSYASSGIAQPFSVRHVLVVLMIALTLVSQLGIAHKMGLLRDQMGEIDLLAATDARRVEFNRLHQWSTRLEGTVLLLGLVVIYLTARSST
jgi:uncharacterized membrane protein